MAKIPAKLIVDVAKNHGPKAIKLLNDNKAVILGAAPFIGTGVAKIKNLQADRKKASAAREHYRKTRYSEYKNVILVKLSDLNKLQLVNYIDEVESFIAQIENEENEEFVLKKPLHSKRRDDWKKVLIQLEDKMSAMDYQEYRNLFNNPTYISSYFEGYDRKLSFYKKLISEDNIEDIHEFISANTKKSLEVIKRDFM
ncbi:hypothetical protein ACQKDB_17155 [Planococcus kocurii]|uniref:hypothetical protein n=1 Tax=Planococcus kocurii TaxID=1374 RepID=UPI003D092FB5